MQQPLHFVMVRDDLDVRELVLDRIIVSSTLPMISAESETLEGFPIPDDARGELDSSDIRVNRNNGVVIFMQGKNSRKKSR